MSVDLGDGIYNLLLPPRMQRFLKMTYFPLVFLTHSMVTIDPFFSNVAVTVGR